MIRPIRPIQLTTNNEISDLGYMYDYAFLIYALDDSTVCIFPSRVTVHIYAFLLYMPLPLLCLSRMLARYFYWQ